MKEKPALHISEESNEDEALLRSELPEDTTPAALQRIIDDLQMSYEHMASSAKPEREKFHPLQNGVDHFVEELLNPKSRKEIETNIRMKNKELNFYNRLALGQMRIADFIFSYPGLSARELENGRLRDLDVIIKNGGLHFEGETFDLGGIKGLAAAMTIFSRDGAYEYYYTHPLIDTVLKGDMAYYHQDRDEYGLIQLKRQKLPGILPVLLPAEAVAERLSPRPQERDKENKIRKDLGILLDFTAALKKRYRENFASFLMLLPSPATPNFQNYYDHQTGLPKEEFFAILEKVRERRGLPPAGIIDTLISLSSLEKE